MTNKKTYKEMFTELLALCETEEQTAFVEKQIALLDKKSASRKSTDYSALQEVVLSVLANGKGMTLGEIANADSAFTTDEGIVFSTSKMNAIVKDLVADGRLTKAKEKGKMVFRLA